MPVETDLHRLKCFPSNSLSTSLRPYQASATPLPPPSVIIMVNCDGWLFVLPVEASTACHRKVIRHTGEDTEGPGSVGPDRSRWWRRRRREEKEKKNKGAPLQIIWWRDGHWRLSMVWWMLREGWSGPADDRVPLAGLQWYGGGSVEGSCKLVGTDNLWIRKNQYTYLGSGPAQEWFYDIKAKLLEGERLAPSSDLVSSRRFSAEENALSGYDEVSLQWPVSKLALEPILIT